MLSRATLEKILRENVPENIVIQKETIDWINESSADFLSRVGKEANSIAEQNTKRESYRINAEHVIQALKNIGKSDYNAHLESPKKSEITSTTKKKKSSKTRKKETITHEELLAEQNALFKKASLRVEKEGW